MVVSLLVMLATVSVIRIRLLDLPLERDEGEYAYAGQLLLQGTPPYEQVYTMKLPGTCAVNALIMSVFGQTPAGIHAGLIGINLMTAILVFLLAKRCCGNLGGVVAAGTYALLSISPPTFGLAAHATHFVMLPALAGVVLLQNLEDRTPLIQIFCAGLLIGLAVLMKQSGAAFGLFAASWIVWWEFTQERRQWRRLTRRLAYLALGGLLPLVLTGSVLAAAGVFPQFWLWTFHYARSYISIVTFSEGTEAFAQTLGKLVNAAPGLWGAAMAGLLLLFGEPTVRRWRFFVFSFLCFSFLAVCPGWFFRGHYFLQLIPAAALLAAVAAQGTANFLARTRFPFPPATIPCLILAVAAIGSLFKSRAIFFQLAPAQASRAVYGANPFPESVEIGRYLASHCPPAARIAVIGSEPQIYFYSRRRSATGCIYTYPLMEPQPYATAMQQQMIREIEAANPQFVVFVNIRTSWLGRPDSNRLIFDWFDQYSQKNLQQVGLIDVLSASHTEYRWFNPQEPVASPRSERWLAVFKNRSASAGKKELPE